MDIRCAYLLMARQNREKHTMEGIVGDENLEGLIPLSLKYLFQPIKKMESLGWNFQIKSSFLEIYNETIRDLLSPNEEKLLKYEIKYLNNKDIYVTNLKTIVIENESQAHDLLKKVQENRTVASTILNQNSSRSHCIVKLKITGVNTINNLECEGSLSLIDLPGSERLKKSKCVGARLTETKYINSSLSNLANVIMALKNGGYVPFRNSKLTHLLKDSLGGNSKTLMLVNVCALKEYSSETMSPLNFAANVNKCHIGNATKLIKL